MLNHLMLDKVLSFAARGWKILPVWGHDEGKCRCKRGADCPSPGKHPIQHDWPGHATDRVDTIRSWFDKYEGCNWGVKLGEESGVIDVEFDDAAGRAVADKLFKDVHTMTYTSGRSDHRFFKWHPDLPQQAVIKKHGLEIRTGGGKKAAMSIIPPSVHPSGVSYHEVQGFGVADVGVVDLPEVFWNLINSSADDEYAVEGGVEPKDEIDVDAEVTTGNRNAEMLRYGCSMAKMMRSVSSSKEKKLLMASMAGHNVNKFKPPLDQHELDLVFQSVLKYSTQDDVDAASKRAAYTELGLKVTDQGEWFPGTWHLDIIESDPVTYKVWAPGLKEGYVEFDKDTFFDHNSVAKYFSEASGGKVVLNDVPTVFRNIWEGTPPSKNNPSGYTGVRGKLQHAAKTYTPPKEETRKYQILRGVVEVVTGREFTDDFTDERQTVYDVDGVIWFKFYPLLGKMQMDDKTISKNELSRTLGKLGIKSSQPYREGIKYNRMHSINEDAMQRLVDECS